MKMKLMALSIFLFSFIFPVHASETLTLDPNHTFVLFQIKHFNYSTQVGKWYATGDLVLDKDNPKNSKVKAVIQVADVITGIPKLDEHIKSKAFFDADQFKTATFESNKIDMANKKMAKIHGILTMHGISKPVVLNVKLNHEGMNPINNKMTYGFGASTKIKRSDFGMTTLLPGLSDEVQLDIQVEASPADKPKA